MNRKVRSTALLALVVFAQAGWRSPDSQTGAPGAVFPAPSGRASTRRNPSAPAPFGSTRCARRSVAAGAPPGMIMVSGAACCSIRQPPRSATLHRRARAWCRCSSASTVTNGKIPLRKSLRDLGIEDNGGLLPPSSTRPSATCSTARSGVYHPAANLGDASDTRRLAAR